MKRKSLAFVILFSLTLPQEASATAGGSTTAGNGGHGIVCKGAYERAELLEFYESRTRYGFEMDLSPENAPARLQAVLQGPVMVSEFLGDATRLANTIRFVRTVASRKVGGPYQRRWPSRCEIQTIAKTYFVDGEHRVDVDAGFYRLLTRNQKFALSIHEALQIYFFGDSELVRHAMIYLGAPDSFRELNRELFNRFLKTGRPIDFLTGER